MTNADSRKVQICAQMVKRGIPADSGVSKIGQLGSADFVVDNCEEIKRKGFKPNFQRIFIDPSAGDMSARAEIKFQMAEDNNRKIKFANGSTNEIIQLVKTVGLHDIRYSYLDRCDLSLKACEFSVMWFSNGDYPKATVYLENLTEGNNKLIVADQATGIDFLVGVDRPGAYQFILKSNNKKKTSKILARSAIFHVRAAAGVKKSTVSVQQSTAGSGQKTQATNTVVIYHDPISGYATNGWVKDPDGTDVVRNLPLYSFRGPLEIGRFDQRPLYGVYYQEGYGIGDDFGIGTRPRAGSSPQYIDLDGTTTIQSPSITIPSSGDSTLRFYYFMGSYSAGWNNDYFEVQIVAGGQVQTLWRNTAPSGVSVPSEWAEKTINLNAYAGQNIKVRFKAVDGNYYRGYPHFRYFGDNQVFEVGFDDIRVEVIETNIAPVVSNPGNQNDRQGAAVILGIAASDADGDTLNYSATDLPTGLVINTNSGEISGALQTAGTFNVTVSVSDGDLTGSASFEWLVTANTAPTLTSPGNQIGILNDDISLTIVASDTESDALTYTADGLPGGLSIDAFSGVIAGGLDSTGNFSVTVTVSDGLLSSSAGFNWLVNPPNTAPVLTQPLDQVNLVAEDVSLMIVATDAEGDALNYSASGLPTGLSINTQTGEISGIMPMTPLATVVVVVSDGSLSDSASFTWGVTNTPPSVAVIPDQVHDAGTSVLLQINANDLEGDTLFYSATGLPASLSIHSGTGLINGTLQNGGPYSIAVTVSDGSSSSSSGFIWSVNNTPPVVTQPLDKVDTIGDSVSLTIVAVDTLGDILSYTASSLPSSLAINVNSGLISGVLTASGTFNVTATVSDGDLLTPTSFVWVVNNTAPTITPLLGRTDPIDKVISLAIEATDSEGGILSYSATGLPTGLSISATSGNISGVLQEIDVFNVTVTVSDGDMNASDSFTWEVTNAAPVVTELVDQTNITGDEVSLAVIATDTAGDVLSYSATGLPVGLSIDGGTGVISGVLLTADAFSVTITVNDGYIVTTISFVWVVANAPPTVTNPGGQASLVGASTYLEITAIDQDENPDTYSAVGLPAGLNIDVITGVITGVVSAIPGNYTVTIEVNDGFSSGFASFDWKVYQLRAVSELKHIWIDEAQKEFKLAWRYSSEQLTDTYQTSIYFIVRPGTLQGEPAPANPMDVAYSASLGVRIWQSSMIDGDSYLGRIYYVRACVDAPPGDPTDPAICGPLAAVNIETASAGNDFQAVTNLTVNTPDQNGNFTMSWEYDADYFNSTTGRPETFQVATSLPQANSVPTVIIIPAGDPSVLSWQQTLDDDDYLGSSYTIAACNSSGDSCGPKITVAVIRSTLDASLPAAVWNHGNKTIPGGSTKFSLDWSVTNRELIDYFSVQEKSYISRPTGPGNGGPQLVRYKTFFTEDQSLDMERVTPGVYEFTLSSCRRDRSLPNDPCGNGSETIIVTIDPPANNMVEITNPIWYFTGGLDGNLQWEYPTEAFSNNTTRPDYFLLEHYSTKSLNQFGAPYWLNTTTLVDVSSVNLEVGLIWTLELPQIEYGEGHPNFEGFEWRIQACKYGVGCGAIKSLDVWNTNPSATPTLSLNSETLSEVLGGPTDMRPGEWIDEDLAGTGWSFYWASELRYDAVHEDYGNTYDLMAYWYTYAAIDSNTNIWRPVWVRSKLKLDTGPSGEQYFRGDLSFPVPGENGDDSDNDIKIGTLIVKFNQLNNNKVTALVEMDGSFGLSLPIGGLKLNLTYLAESEVVGPPPQDPGGNPSRITDNPDDHYQGTWASNDGNNDFIVNHWIERSFESVLLAAYDAAGLPIWARGDWQDICIEDFPNKGGIGTIIAEPATCQLPPASPAQTFNLYTVKEGYDPKLGTPVGYDVDSEVIYLGSNSNPSGGQGCGGVGTLCREFVDYRDGRVNININKTLPGGGPSGRGWLLQTSNSTVADSPTKKVASLHDIRFLIDNEAAAITTCHILQGETCDIQLTWFTDNYYPDFTVFRVDKATLPETYTEIYRAPTNINEWQASIIDFQYSINKAGEYRFELWKHNDRALPWNAKIAESENILKVRNESDAMVDQPIQISAPPSFSAPVTQVGATQGEFRVDESGSATYSIPIVTGPGPGGITPQLSLHYSSQAGNSVMGVGWNIGGTSTITRCAQTLEQDGVPGTRAVKFTSDDRFCLDGQRLLLISSGNYGDPGTEYRAEVDNISRIIAVGSAGNGPESFIVRRKDGSTSEYGNSDDSRIEARTSTDSSTVYTWAQNNFQDSAGNRITYKYSEIISQDGMVDYVLKSAATGDENSPTTILTFTYDDRTTDIQKNYIAGAGFIQSKLLKSVLSKSRAKQNTPLETLRYYQMEYGVDTHGRDNLLSVQECNRSEGDCYDATTFEWTQNRNTIPNVVYSNKKVLPTKTNNLQIGDINGDGEPDLIYARVDDGNPSRTILELRVRLSYTIGWGVPSLYSMIAYIDHAQGGEKSVPPIYPIDLNADGYVDIVYPQYNGSTYGWEALMSVYDDNPPVGSPDRKFAKVMLTAEVDRFSIDKDELRNFINVLDFDGDGLSDLVYNQTSQVGGENKLRVFLNTYTPETGVGLSASTLNIDTEDLFLNTLLPTGNLTQDGYVALQEAPFYIWNGDEKSDIPSPMSFDYNADGAVDLLLKIGRLYQYCTKNCSGVGTPVYSYGKATFWILLETKVSPVTGDQQYVFREVLARGGDCIVTQFCTDLPEYANLPKTDYLLPVDINADGLADIAYSGDSGDSAVKNKWYAKINKGNQFSAAELIYTVPVNNAQPVVRFTDWNGDGYPDLIYPSDINDQNAKWTVVFNRSGEGFYTQNPYESDLPAGSVGGSDVNADNDLSLFIDFTGDGRPDYFFVNYGGDGVRNTNFHIGENLYNVNQQDPRLSRNMITGFTNGLGAVTTVSYAPLTDAAVYTRFNNSSSESWGAGSAVYDLIAPHFVVGNVKSSAPTSIESSQASSPQSIDSTLTSEISYHYAGAKLQAGGRGYLGFSEIVTYDPQSGVRTNTRYRQDFPYIGMPADTTQVYLPSETLGLIGNAASTTQEAWGAVNASTPAPGIGEGTGVLLSYSINQWDVKATAGNAVFPYIKNSLEITNTLSGAGDRKVFTNSFYAGTQNIDSYGNLKQVSVETYDNTNNANLLFSRQTTVNQFTDENANLWHLGRITKTTVTHSRPGTVDIVRVSSFEYDNDPVTGTGILVKEIIEPTDSVLKVETAYDLDNFGNRIKTTVTGANMSPRISTATYDPLGRFVIQSAREINGEVQTTQTIDTWDIFGNPLITRNIDGVVSENHIDDMGRPFARQTETGAWTQTISAYGGSVNGQALCPASTSYHTITTAAGKPEQFQCYDLLGRAIRSGTQSFDGNKYIFTDQIYDNIGRVKWVSQPYYSNSSNAVYWNQTAYDALGRTLGQLNADGGISTYEYNNQSAINAARACDASLSAGLARVVLSRQAVFSNLAGAKELTRIELKNPLGEATDVFDHNCGQVSYAYDATGNLLGVLGATINGSPGSLVTMVYDKQGRKTSMSDPDKGDWSYRYNALGELIEQTDAKQQTIQFSLDDLGRMTDRREINNLGVVVNREHLIYRSVADANSDSLGGGGIGKIKSSTYYQGNVITPGTFLQQKTIAYDAFGRVHTTSTDIPADAAIYAEKTIYDEYGRVFQQFDASGDSRGLRWVYNTQGYPETLREAREGSAGQVYQTIKAMSAYGVATEVLLGNGVTAWANYDDRNGRLLNQSASDNGTNIIQNISYQFDTLGNLETRHDTSLNAAVNMYEAFSYDNLNRLLAVNLTANNATPLTTHSLTYDETGNILSKSDVGSYQYGQNGAGPHAVTTAGGISYAYDNNGNQVSSSLGRLIEYTVFDKAAVISNSLSTVRFHYGIGNNRYQRVDYESLIAEKTTTYIGNVEYIQTLSGARYFKRYLGDFAVVTYYPGSGVSRAEYLLKDHIGSVHTVLQEDGEVVQLMHFSAFGERQSVINWQDLLVGHLFSAENQISTRGFTGHEMVDSVGIIHMNGRIYDPKLGRFLQADPFVQAPKNSQSLNRYSYVFNNPLSNTDPTGYFSLSGFVKKYWRAAASILISVYLPVNLPGTWSIITKGAVTGFVAGGVATGTFNGAVVGAFTGQAFGALHGFAPVSTGGRLVKVAAHGIVGGAGSSLSGGRFGNGFVAAGFTQAVGQFGGDDFFAQSGSTSDRLNNVIKAAMIGGTASALTGGKFANGAVTGAFSRALNDEAGKPKKISGGYTLNGPDNSDDPFSTLITDPETMIAWYMSKEMAANYYHAKQSGTSIGDYTRFTEDDAVSAAKIVGVAGLAFTGVGLVGNFASLSTLGFGLTVGSGVTQFSLNPSSEVAASVGIDLVTRGVGQVIPGGQIIYALEGSSFIIQAGNAAEQKTK
ncbi:MAG: putative Ig domain-containing protein [Xanthomonadales bacterium]|nr:putative Ig domain-containing protein [Xanthomonadales bacterium]